MRITYDQNVDALYIRFKETTVTTKHLGEGIAADYDADGRLADRGSRRREEIRRSECVQEGHSRRRGDCAVAFRPEASGSVKWLGMLPDCIKLNLD